MKPLGKETFIKMTLAYIAIIAPLLLTLSYYLEPSTYARNLVIFGKPPDYTAVYIALAQITLTLPALFIVRKIRGGYKLLSFCYLFFVVSMAFPLIVDFYIYCNRFCWGIAYIVYYFLSAIFLLALIFSAIQLKTFYEKKKYYHFLALLFLLLLLVLSIF